MLCELKVTLCERGRKYVSVITEINRMRLDRPNFHRKQSMWSVAVLNEKFFALGQNS